MELGDPIFHLKRPRVKPINIEWLQISNYHTNITRLCNRFTILLAIFQYFQDFDILLLFAYYTWSSLREYAPCSKKFICWFSACLKPITEKKTCSVNNSFIMSFNYTMLLSGVTDQPLDVYDCTCLHKICIELIISRMQMTYT